MKVSSKEFKRALRDLENFSNDLVNSSHESYKTLIERFLSFIKMNPIMNQIITPIYSIEFNSQEYLKIRNNGWGDLITPPNVDVHIALMLELFDDFISNKDSLTQFILTYYYNSNINNNLYTFNSEFVQPGLRELINRISDFYEDEIEGKEEVDYSKIQIFQIGSITNKNGNIALGENINILQSSTIQNLPDEFVKLLLNNGYSYSDFDKVKNDIEELKEELLKPKPDENKLKSIFKKVLDAGGKGMLNLLTNLISKPDITTAIISSIM